MRELMTVKSVDERYVYLSLNVDKVACASCGLSGSCSIQNESSKKVVFKINKRNVRQDLLPLVPGDLVVVDFKYNPAILSLIVYGIPLAGFILGTLIGYLLKFSDIVSFILALALTGGGAFLTRIYDRKYKIEIIDVRRNTVTLNTGQLS
jgi:sigma-E factor negative regulatory protein RseC